MELATSFEKPAVLQTSVVSFPDSIEHLVPKFEDIPDEFKDPMGPWMQFYQYWQWPGFSEQPLVKKGLNSLQVWRHLSVINRSIELRRDHKSAAFAYLASKWIVLPEPDSWN